MTDLGQTPFGTRNRRNHSRRERSSEHHPEGKAVPENRTAGQIRVAKAANSALWLDRVRRQVPTGLWIPLTLIASAFLALIGLQTGQALMRGPELARARTMVLYTSDVINTVQSLKTALQDAERGQRGYLLTGESTYLERYNQSARDISRSLTRLQRLTGDTPEQRRWIPLLIQESNLKRQAMQQALEIYSRDGLEAAQAILRNNAGLDAMRSIDDTVTAVVRTERELLERRLAQAAQDERTAVRASVVCELLAVTVMVAGVMLTLLAAHNARRLEARRLVDEHRLSQELAQAQAAFTQSQKMEALGQATSSVAHDVNNFLHTISSALMLSQRGLCSEDPQVHHFLDIAKRAADRASRTINRLLAFARQQPLSVALLDASLVVAGMADLLQFTVGESIAVETGLRRDLWTVSADANQLETALLNLAVNARDAMAGRGKLTIETRNVYLDETITRREYDVPPGQYVRIAVTDSGTGMTPEVVNRAFDPFFTTKPVGLGTGLGLSQVIEFVKHSGGDVRIHSEPGIGTTVALYLPRALAAAPVGQPAVRPAKAASLGHSGIDLAGQNPRIFVPLDIG
jgi:signal transduction histidine kinase